MKRLLGVVGASPLTVDGLSGALLGCDIERVISVDLPLRVHPLACLILYVNGHRSIGDLRAVRSDMADLPIVAVLSNGVWGGPALMAGATSAVGATSSTAEVARVIISCLDGAPIVSTHLAIEIMRLSQEPSPSSGEIALLDQLASGESIRVIAERMGYSERHVHRRLKHLYEMLSVDTRIGAVEIARRRGWLATHVDSAWSTPQRVDEP